ncbi:hypothetical protein Bca4012_082844 [Brassica carinata]
MKDPPVRRQTGKAGIKNERKVHQTEVTQEKVRYCRAKEAEQRGALASCRFLRYRAKARERRVQNLSEKENDGKECAESAMKFWADLEDPSPLSAT